MNDPPVDITPENAREMFMSAASVFVKNCGENPRQRLVEILKTNDSNVRDALATCVNEENVIGSFICACSVDDAELMQSFHEIGMNVNAKDQNGNTPLVGATNNSQKKSVRWLLDHGADVNIPNKDGWTPLMCASWSGEIDVVEMLLQNNANPDLQNINGQTVLMTASLNGYNDTVRLLLNYNADIELRDKEGKTALDLTKNEEIKQMLLNHVNTTFVLK